MHEVLWLLVIGSPLASGFVSFGMNDCLLQNLSAHSYTTQMSPNHGKSKGIILFVRCYTEGSQVSEKDKYRTIEQSNDE